MYCANVCAVLLQMEFCPRTLQTVLEAPIKEEDAWAILRGILSGEEDTWAILRGILSGEGNAWAILRGIISGGPYEGRHVRQGRGSSR